MIDTIAPTEVAWTAVAIIGVIVSFVAILDALGDARFLTRNAQKLDAIDLAARKIVSSAATRHEAVRLFIQTVFAGVGIAALLTLPPSGSNRPTAIGWIIAAGFIFAECILVWDSLVDRRARKRLLELEVVRLQAEAARVPGTPIQATVTLEGTLHAIKDEGEV